MKKFKQKLVFLVLLLFITSCKIIKFDDINEHKGSTILNIEHEFDSFQYKFIIKDTLGNYKVIIIKDDLGKLFEVGDTI